MARHVAFCGRSGNEDHALSLIERHLGWLDRPSSPFAAMEFTAGTAHVLGRLRATGRGDMPVRRRTDDGTRRWVATVAEVHDEMAARSVALAARFDARNGNTYQSDRVAAQLAATPLVDRLPLTVLAGRIATTPTDPAVRDLIEQVAVQTAAGDAAGAARTRLQVAYALRNADRWQDAAEAAEEAVRSLERAHLDEDAVRCRHLLWELYRRSYEHRREALAVLDTIATAAAVPADLPGFEVLLEQAGDLLYDVDAADRFFAAHGDLPVVELGRFATVAAWSAVRAGHPDEALRRADRAVDCFESADTATERFSALLVRARVLLATGRARDAELPAREVLAAKAGAVTRSAGIVVAGALRAQGRRADVEAFMSEHGIDEWELDEDDEDASYEI